jgi:hypothetical protein
MEEFWQEFTPKIRGFIYDDEVRYFIPISNIHPNNEKFYIVVSEDAHHLDTGKSEILTENQIIEKYKIYL